MAAAIRQPWRGSPVESPAAGSHTAPAEGGEGSLQPLVFNLRRPFDRLRDPPAPVDGADRLGFMINSRTEKNSWLLQVILYDHGWVRLATDESGWDLWWCAGQAHVQAIRALNPWQRLNKFPKSSHLTLKANLYETITAAALAHGQEHFAFVPDTFVLPAQRDAFEAARDAADTSDVWIVKPFAAYCGRGIFLLGNSDVLPVDAGEERSVACRYIDPPHLIHQLKYDIRLYVLVTCWHPLVVYVNCDGLVRFATDAYSTEPSTLSKRTAHITNYAVNKRSSNFRQTLTVDDDGTGSKWSLDALHAHLVKEVGVDRAKDVWAAVDDIVVKTCIAAEPAMTAAYEQYVPRNVAGQANAALFQVFGFDVMLDAQLKPWLLEVNLDPALGTDSPLDLKVIAPATLCSERTALTPPTYASTQVKGSMLVDALNLLGILGSAQHGDEHRAGLQQRPTRPMPCPTADVRAVLQVDGEQARGQGGSWRRLLPNGRYRHFLAADRRLNDLPFRPWSQSTKSAR